MQWFRTTLTSPRMAAVYLENNVGEAGFPNHIYHAQLEGNCPFLMVFSIPESSSMLDTFLINIDE